ncbi:MAG TPA: hypothetical protein VMZ28_24725 [Kofleriaceae bacterium]|nr:hypothetical protein [Kofleriaceae bacterium]
MKPPAAIAAAALAFLLLLSRRARAEDEWVARDKGLHAAASAIIAAGGYGASAPWIEERPARAAVGAGLALAAGVAKELWDAAGHGDPSVKDLAADALGTAVGVGLAILIDLAASR